MVEAKRKSIILATIADMIRILLGKYILVIKDEAPTRELHADKSELENKFQGNRAT